MKLSLWTRSPLLSLPIAAIAARLATLSSHRSQRDCGGLCCRAGGGYASKLFFSHLQSANPPSKISPPTPTPPPTPPPSCASTLRSLTSPVIFPARSSATPESLGSHSGVTLGSRRGHGNSQLLAGPQTAKPRVRLFADAHGKNRNRRGSKTGAAPETIRPAFYFAISCCASVAVGVLLVPKVGQSVQACWAGAPAAAALQSVAS